MKDQTLTVLRAQAKARGLKGYSKLTKDELLRRLGEAPATPAPTAAAQSTKPRRKAPARSTTASRGSVPSPHKTKRVATAEPAAVATPAKSTQPFEPPTTTEELVESAKYALGGTHTAPAPSPDLGEDIDRLPTLHEPAVCLLAQKPGVLYAYWSLPRRETHSDYKLRLARTDARAGQILEEVSVHGERGTYYFHVPEDIGGQALAVQLGYYRDGQFVVAQGQSSARLPSLYASTRTDHRWWVSEQEFAQLYLRAGGVITAAHRYGWSASTSSRAAPAPDKQMAWPGGVSSASK